MNSTDVAPAGGVGGAERCDTGDGEPCWCLLGEDGDGVADVDVALVGRTAIDHDLVVADGLASFGEPERVERLVADPVETERGRLFLVADDVAVGIHQLGVPGHLQSGVGDTVDTANAVDRVGGEPCAGLAIGGLDVRFGADHGIDTADGRLRARCRTSR